MTRKQKLQKIARLSNFDGIREGATKALRREFPNAPQAMIDTAIFHVYVDGVDAVLDWLVSAVDSITEGTPLPDHSTTWHLLYHVYNWFRFRDLIPSGSQELLDLIEGLEECVNDDDRDTMRDHMKRIKDVIEATRPPPSPEP